MYKSQTVFTINLVFPFSFHHSFASLFIPHGSRQHNSRNYRSWNINAGCSCRHHTETRRAWEEEASCPDACVTMETEQINVFFCFALLSLKKQQRETEGLVSFTNMSILIWPRWYWERWPHNGTKRKMREKDRTWGGKKTTRLVAKILYWQRIQIICGGGNKQWVKRRCLKSLNLI